MRGQTAGGETEETPTGLLHYFIKSLLIRNMNETDFHLQLSEYSFERRFDERGAIEWMRANWWANKFMLFRVKRWFDSASGRFKRLKPSGPVETFRQTEVSSTDTLRSGFHLNNRHFLNGLTVVKSTSCFKCVWRRFRGAWGPVLVSAYTQYSTVKRLPC